MAWPIIVRPIEVGFQRHKGTDETRFMTKYGLPVVRLPSKPAIAEHKGQG
jgi:hypothetical protein